jgi:hypothetical protein
MPAITPEESFLIQAYALAECHAKFSELEAQKNPLLIKNKDQILGTIGRQINTLGLPIFGGQGTLISVFYTLLVLPFEWKKNEVGDFARLDLSGAEKMANEQVILSNEEDDTYPKKDIALTHFRNALAHGHVGWENGNLVINDTYNGKHYTAQYTTDSLGMLADSLRDAILHYVETVINART